MNVLEKILEEIEERLKMVGNIPVNEDDDFLDGEECYEDGRVQGRYEELLLCRNIIRSHINELPKCGECSRRKWYQMGFEDGKKDNDWIPVEEKLPEKEVIAQNVYNEMMIGYVYYSEEMEWYGCESDDVYLSNVVAWRPLPETYKKHRQ